MDAWWRAMEAEQGGTFDRRRSFAELDEAARTSPYFPAFDDEEFEECGDQCAA